MAEWAHVEDGVIKELHDQLPVAWRNISGLNLSSGDTDFLATLGWIPVTKQYQDYDTITFKISGYNYQYIDGKVLETLQLAEIPPNETVDVQRNIRRMMEIRKKRNDLLAQSDWTQLQDVQSILSEEQKYRWKKYRQDLRDLPAKYSDINNKPFNVEWPVLESYIWPPAGE